MPNNSVKQVLNIIPFTDKGKKALENWNDQQGWAINWMASLTPRVKYIYCLWDVSMIAECKAD